MALEIALIAVIAIIYFVENCGFAIKSSEFKNLWLILPVLLISMPTYAIQGLFGFANVALEIKSFTLPHRIILYLSIIIPVIIFFLLKNKSHNEKKFWLLLISNGTLISYSLGHKFASFLVVSNWPFH